MDNLHDSTIPTQAVSLLRTWSRSYRRVGRIITTPSRSTSGTTAVSLRAIIEAYLDDRYPGWRRAA